MLQSAIQTYLKHKGVSEVEQETLELALAGKPAESIAKQLAISEIAVRKRMGSVYSKLAITGKTHGKLARLREQLTADQPIVTIGPVPDTSSIFKPGEVDWHMMQLSESMAGRQADLATLQDWVGEQSVQLLVLWGLGGVGKTTLTRQLVQSLQGKFQHGAWRSLQDAPSFSQFLDSLLPQAASAPEAGIEQLIHCLQTERCLLILDNWDAILGDRQTAPDVGAASGNGNRAAYQTLLRRISAVPHQSCVIITSREKPSEMTLLENSRSRSYQVRGLEADAAQQMLINLAVFDRDKLASQPVEFAELVQRCGGNPLTIKIVATLIHDVFAGDISRFLQQGQIGGLSQINPLLSQQIARLSPAETTLLYSIAIVGGNASFDQLRHTVAPMGHDGLRPTEGHRAPAIANLTPWMEALQSLQRRALIETDQPKQRYRLHPVIREFLLNRLIQTAIAELETTPDAPQYLAFLRTYPLYQAQAPYRTRRFQLDFIISPFIAELQARYGEAAAIKAAIQTPLTALQRQPKRQTGSAAGNLINLLLRMPIDLQGIDLSHLAIQQVSFRTAVLHDVDLREAECADCTFQGVLSGVFAIVFHPDNTELFTGDGNGRITRWSLQSGEQISSQKAHSDWIRALVYDPQRRYLISAGDDHKIKLWEVTANSEIKKIKTLRSHTDHVRTLAIHPRHPLFASGGRDGRVQVWNGITDLPIAQTNAGFLVRSTAFHPTATCLAFAGDSNQIYLWNWETGTTDRLTQPEGNPTWANSNRAIQSIVFSPDGKTLASCAWYNEVVLWSIDTQTIQQTLNTELDGLRSLAFSPDGHYLAGGGDNKQSQVWDLTTGVSIARLEGHAQSIQVVAFSPDGKSLATGSEDKTVVIWGIGSDTATAIKKTTPTVTQLQTLRGYDYWVQAIAVSPDGKLVAAAGDDGSIRLWPQPQHWLQSVPQLLNDHRCRLWAIEFSPDRRWLASAGDDKNVQLWDVQKRRPIAIFPHDDWVRALAFSPDRQWLATGSTDQTVRLWNVRSRKLVEAPRHCHENWIRTVCFSRDGAWLFSAGDDAVVVVYHPATQQEYRLRGHESRIWALALDHTGEVLVSASDDGMVKFWDWRSQQQISEINQSISVRTIACHPQQNLLAIGGGNPEIGLWQFDDVKQPIALKQATIAHENWVRSLRFHPTEPWLFSGGQDGYLSCWDIAQWQLVQQSRPDRPYERMQIQGLKGLSKTQRQMLEELGAID
jgi:WD40 repeat protein/DNA-binding CsgD family transcriptional regulator